MASRWRRSLPSARWGQAKSSTWSAPSSSRPKAPRASSPSTRRTRSTSGFPASSRSTIDVPAGAFRGRPPTPDDTVTTLAITYRFVAPNTMLDAVAGAIARSIFKTKAQLIAKTPLASQIEAPDPDNKNPILPVHPGVVAYLNSGKQSFFDEFQKYFYLGGMVLSMVGSAIALLVGRLNRKKSENDLRQIDRLIELADKALAAQTSELKALEEELNRIIAWFVKGQASGTADSTAFSIAIAHARHAIEKQREALRQRQAGSMPQQSFADHRKDLVE